MHHDDDFGFDTSELLQLARNLRAEIRKAGLDHRTPAASDLVEQLTEAALREASTGLRITPVLGSVDEPKMTGRLVAQL
ncbi:MAG: hypothetical protein AAGA99_13595 [Actinomycetota bacterium]